MLACREYENQEEKKNYSKLIDSNGIVSIHYHLKIRHKKSCKFKKKRGEIVMILDADAGSSALYVRVCACMRVLSELQSAELLVHGQDVVVQFGRE